MKFGVLLCIILTIGTVPVQYVVPFISNHLVLQASALNPHPNLFVSAENSQYNNYFAGPQVIQVIVSDPSINRLNQHYGEPVVTVNGKRLRMAQGTDGNWYGYFADRNQAEIASNTAPLKRHGLNFGALCGTGVIGGINFGLETKGFAMAQGNATDGKGVSVTGAKVPIGGLSNACTDPFNGNATIIEHVVRENKTLNSNPSGYGAPQGLVNAWPVIQLYDFSAIPTPVTVDYQASGGTQEVDLTFDRIPSNLISVTPDKTSYPNGAQVYLTMNDPQLNIDPTEEDSWTWGANANNNTLFYEAFDRNGERDADGTAAMQNLAGNLTAMMFNHNGKFTINPFSGNVLVIDFQSNGKQMLNSSATTSGDPTKQSTKSISLGSEPITFIENSGVNTGIFANWDGFNKSNVAIVNNLNTVDRQATFSYNDVSGNIVANPSKFTILLKSGGVTPPNNTSSIASIQMGVLSTQRIHFLVQFSSIPSSTDIAQLAKQGISLTEYVTGYTYIASSTASDVNTLSSTPNVRWVGPFLPTFKISPLLSTNDTKNFPAWAFVNSPNKSLSNNILLTIQLNRDADIGSVAQSITNYGGTIKSEVPLIPAITAYFSSVNLPNTVRKIAELDGVQFIDVVDPPVVDQSDKARAAANIDFVQKQEPSSNANGLSAYGLLGDDVSVLLYDGGTVFTHPDFYNRVTYVGGSCNETHATHVAGILGGSGINSNSSELCQRGAYCNGTDRQWAGMAPHINIVSVGYDKLSHAASNTCYPSYYNDEKNFTNDYDAIKDNNVNLASMSIASAVNSTCCLDQYTLTSSVIDNITTGMIANQNLPIFEAAGNERIAPYGNFSTIDPPATAKNSIAVGAINSKDFSILDQSGFGPTADGRIKPDITAPGCYGNIATGTMISTDYDQGTGYPDYDSACGTSEATPVAAGAAALLIEKWHELHGSWSPILPSTVKAILIHTALDLGNPGPDYEFGWGALNAKAAIKLVDEDGLSGPDRLINVANITQGAETTFNFISNSNEDVKATLVWDDPPPSPLANIELVNQLNLTLISPNKTLIQPYLLNPNEPNDTALRGNDIVNNVKMAVGNGTIGTWTAVVDGSVPYGNQTFTLILSNILKRTTSTVVEAPSIVNNLDPVTISATVLDNDTGTPLPVSGNVTFDDGNNGDNFTSPICTQQNGYLVCTAEYTPANTGKISINTNYSGDQVHDKSTNYQSGIQRLRYVTPEFPFAIPIMTAGFFSLLIFYRIRLGNGK
jgi:Subtilase family